MKKLLLFLITVIIGCDEYAQVSHLLMSENFTGYTTGNLNTNSNGQGSWKASFSNNSSGFVQVAVASPLMYPDYTSGTQYINVKQKDAHEVAPGKYPDDPIAGFTNGTVPIHSVSTSFYLSFLVRVPSVAGVSAIGDARPNIAIRTINGGVFANFYIGIADGGQLKFGISKDGNAVGKFASGAYEFNTTYLIVIRYDVTNGQVSADYDDKMYLWVNPSLAAEPFTSLADVSIDKVQDFDYDGGFDAPAQSLQLFQEPNSATASFDAFKIAYAQGFASDAANAAASWSALSAVGTPLAVTLSDFKGYIKHGQIELSWNVNFGFNIKQYEIERSGDGAHFSYAGTVAARNGENESAYTWVDAFPNGGNNYYRIKNVYKTGNPVYSSVIRLRLKDQASSFTIFPNPVFHGDLFIRETNLQPGDYGIEIFNKQGQTLFKKQISYTGGPINQALILPAMVPKGVYTIQLTGDGLKQSGMFVVL